MLASHSLQACKSNILCWMEKYAPEFRYYLCRIFTFWCMLRTFFVFSTCWLLRPDAFLHTKELDDWTASWCLIGGMIDRRSWRSSQSLMLCDQIVRPGEFNLVRWVWCGVNQVPAQQYKLFFETCLPVADSIRPRTILRFPGFWPFTCLTLFNVVNFQLAQSGRTTKFRFLYSSMSTVL